MKKFFLTILLFLISSPVWATVWYVRDGGGTPAQCTGTTNAVYPGFGTDQPCAINHPSWVIGSKGGTQLMSGGDTVYIIGDSDISWNFTVSGVTSLPAVGDIYTSNGETYTITLSLPTGYTSGIIAAWGASKPPSSGTLTKVSGSGTSPITYTAISTAQAQFMIGYGMPNPGSGAHCAKAYAYDCGLSPVPGGTDSSNLTKVIGIGHYKPQLWGTQGTFAVMSLTQGNYDIEDLEITDHSPCSYQRMDPHGTVDGVSPACKYTGNPYPYGLFAKSGIALAGSNIKTKNLFVHRVASQNIWFSGNVENWNSTNDVFVGSGGGGALTNTNKNNESFSGTNTMNNDLWAYGGCSEHYPDPDPNNALDPANYHHCCDQTCGAYSLGGGFMQQSNSAPCGNWIISNSKFLYNLKTNIDFLHCDGTGTFNFYRSISEGSSGEAIKLNVGQVNMEESQLIGNAPVWYQPALKAIISPYDINGHPTNKALMMCRGRAVTIFNVQPGEHINYINDDVTGNCTALVELKAQSNHCAGSSVNAYNTKFIGGYAYDITGQQVDLFYNGGSNGDGGGNCGSTNSIPFTMVNSSCYDARTFGGIGCDSGTNTITADPLVVGEKGGSLSKLLGPNGYYNGYHFGDLLYLQSNSLLIKSGSTKGVPYTNGSTNDYNNYPADSPIDIGAVQHNSKK